MWLDLARPPPSIYSRNITGSYPSGTRRHHRPGIFGNKSYGRLYHVGLRLQNTQNHWSLQQSTWRLRINARVVVPWLYGSCCVLWSFMFKVNCKLQPCTRNTLCSKYSKSKAHWSPLARKVKIKKTPIRINQIPWGVRQNVRLIKHQTRSITQLGESWQMVRANHLKRGGYNK